MSFCLTSDPKTGLAVASSEVFREVEVDAVNGKRLWGAGMSSHHCGN